MKILLLINSAIKIPLYYFYHFHINIFYFFIFTIVIFIYLFIYLFIFFTERERKKIINKIFIKRESKYRKITVKYLCLELLKIFLDIFNDAVRK